MKNTFKMTAIAAALAGLAAPAMADQAETKGGLTVKTDDGRFEFKLGGRFHIDAYSFLDCETDGATCAPATNGPATVGGMFLRRGYITATGKLYGWKFKSEFDPASSSSAQSTWREAWVSTELAGGELLIGQFKPFRSMEELTSSNEILMMERPLSSATALYGSSSSQVNSVGSRQFQMGAGYKYPLDNLIGMSGMLATSLYNLHQIGGQANEGVGTSTRVTLLPVEQEGLIVHVGAVYGVDNTNDITATAANTVDGRLGISSPAIAGRNSATQVTSPTQSLAASVFAGESQTTYSLEAATAIGPFFLQAEYADSTLGQDTGVEDIDVKSYYVQSSFFLTGETKPYKKDRGTFGTPKPIGEMGAIELKARYDYIENSTDATEPSVTQTTVGANWYLNPNVRFMLDYTMGEGETTASKTEVDALALRTQLSF